MGQTSSAPQPPNLAKAYQQGIQIYLKNLPQMLAQEQAARTQYDPQRIAEQQALQQQFGPAQYQQQLAALQQLDPQVVAMQNALGQQIQAGLERGYVDPRQQALYNQLTSSAQDMLRAGGMTPEQAAAYKALGQGVTTQYGLGTQQDPRALAQEQQYIRAGQSARGNILGNAPLSAEALYQGQRGQQLQQQRTGNVQNYLTLQNPMMQAQQLGQQLYSLQSPTAGALAQAGGYLGSGGPASYTQRVAGIQGVAPDRASAYVNPQAGYQGIAGQLANYPNQVAAQGANPWMGALSGAASGATAGSAAGPYGAAAGALIGAGAGYFSDETLKENIVYAGASPSGVPIYEFNYKGDERRFRGTIAQELIRTPMGWDAVWLDKKTQKLVVDYSKLDIDMTEVS